MQHDSARHILLIAFLSMSPMLAGANCPKPGASAPDGAWIANERDGVYLVEFKPDNQLHIAFESYDGSPLTDGMKAEVTATCVPVNEPAATQGEGWQRFECKDAKILRSTQGFATLINLAQVIGGHGAGPDKASDQDIDFAYELKREGGKILSYVKTDAGHEHRHTYEEVPSHKVKPFLERFREDTVEIQEIKPTRRKRDLP